MRKGGGGNPPLYFLNAYVDDDGMGDLGRFKLKKIVKSVTSAAKTVARVAAAPVRYATASAIRGAGIRSSAAEKILGLTSGEKKAVEKYGKPAAQVAAAVVTAGVASSAIKATALKLAAAAAAKKALAQKGAQEAIDAGAPVEVVAAQQSAADQAAAGEDAATRAANTEDPSLAQQLLAKAKDVALTRGDEAVRGWISRRSQATSGSDSSADSGSAPAATDSGADEGILSKKVAGIPVVALAGVPLLFLLMRPARR